RSGFSARVDRGAPAHQFHAAVAVLDDRAAAVDPVAAVDVGDVVQRAHRGDVDVAADHAVGAARAGRGGDRLLEGAAVVGGGAGALLDPAGQRPVAVVAGAPAQRRPVPVQAQQHAVGEVTERSQKAIAGGHRVPGVAVHEQVATTVGGDVHRLGGDADVAE